MIIYLDFDGTVVEHDFPSIGKYNEGCFQVISKLQDANHEIILNTYRANINFEYVLDAMYFLNDSLKTSILKWEKKKMEPHPWGWGYFKKHDLIFIDDICKGIPMKPAKLVSIPMVDWERVDEEFQKHNIYKSNK